MVKAVIAVSVGVAIVSLIIAVMAARLMLKHRSPAVSGAWFLWNGYAFYTGRNFEPAAEPAHRLYRHAFHAFFGAIAVALVTYFSGLAMPV